MFSEGIFNVIIQHDLKEKLFKWLAVIYSGYSQYYCVPSGVLKLRCWYSSQSSASIYGADILPCLACTDSGSLFGVRTFEFFSLSPRPQGVYYPLGSYPSSLPTTTTSIYYLSSIYLQFYSFEGQPIFSTCQRTRRNLNKTSKFELREGTKTSIKRERKFAPLDLRAL